MTWITRLAIACLAALVLVAGTGCGGDKKSSNDYVKAINKVQTEFASDIQKVGSSAPSGGDPAAKAKETFSDLDAAISKAITDLKAVEPPDDVKDLHDQLISEMTAFGSQVETAGNSLKSGDPQTIVAAQSKFAASASALGQQISKTIGDINTKLQS